MWFRIQSEGFITAAQTGGDIPPNWGHQSSCCCVLSSVQIAPFFNLFTFPSSLSPPPSPLLPSRSLSLGSALISRRLRPPLVCISSGGAVQEQQALQAREEREERGRRKGEEERGRRDSRREDPSQAVDAPSRRRIPTSGAVFFPMSTSVSLTGLIWALIS